MEKCAQSSQLSLFALGIWTICYEPLVSGSYCSLFGVWRNAWFDNEYMFCVSRMAFGSIYNFYVTWWTWLLSSILAMLRLLVFLGNLYIISMSLLYFQLSSQSIFCASRFFGVLEHSQL